MGRQAVFHQPHVYARFANRCCRLFGASVCGYLGIAQRHCMHAVDGNVVFSQVTIHYLGKTLRVLNANRAAAGRMRFEFDDVTLAAVHLLDQLVELILGGTR